MTTITLSTTLSSRPVIGNGGGGGIPPANTVAPVISGTGVVGQTLSCSTGTWTGIPAPTYTYQWLRGVSDIPGATSSTYTLVQADATYTITCQVTATNTVGSASVTSSNSLTIVDADAQSFITAASITNPTQITAVNQLTVDLKGYGVWSKMKAIYPFVGGTASTHKWNLKDPRDLDVAFRLVFNGGWTHSLTGALPNGTNGWANTYLNPSLIQSLNNNGLGCYITENTSISSDPVIMGALTSQSIASNLVVKSNLLGTRLNAAFISSVISGGLGFFSSHKTSSTVTSIYKNNILQTFGNSGGSLPNLNIFLGNMNLSGVAYGQGYVNSQFRLAYISDGLNSTEAANLYTAVQAYQTTLGRSVGPQTVSDPDAQAFVTAANIQDQVQAQAINTLTIDLKNYGVWTKMKAIYPFVGGTATSHSYNLKNTAQYQITWFGGLTHTNTGVKGNGTNGYGDTFLANNVMTQNNIHISSYGTTNNAGNVYSIAAYDNVSGSYIVPRSSAGFMACALNSVTASVNSVTNTLGLFLVTRLSSTQVTHQQNTSQILRTNNSSLPIASTFKLLRLGDLNSGYSLINIAFTSIGDTLSNSEGLNLYTAVQNYQTTLNRQV